LVCNDGIGNRKTAYGEEIGLATGDMILALVLVQFIPTTFALARWRAHWPKPTDHGGLIVYCGVTFAAYYHHRRALYALAVTLGWCRRHARCRARSFNMIPPALGEFFSLLFERFAGIIGPLTMGVAIAIFGGSRPAILSIGLFFIGGLLLLSRVDIEAGRAQATQLNPTR
jgi:UMF1 family MFS transporter